MVRLLAPVRIRGTFGKALSFDGVDDYVDCGNDESLDLFGEITVAAWFRTTQDSVGSICLRKRYNYGTSPGFGLSINNDGQVSFNLGDGTNRADACTTDAYNDGNWHYAVGVKDGSMVYIYIDGVLKGTDTDDVNITAYDCNLMIGQRGWGGNFFNGLIDEVRIYNRALSEEEIRRHFLGLQYLVRG